MFRNSKTVMIVAGILLPLVILYIVAVNLSRGEVYVPSRHGGQWVFDQGLMILAAVIAKLGLALWLFGWFWCANREAMGRYSPLIYSTGAFVGLGGLIFVFVAMAIVLWN